jgi:hypothetical protein
MFRRNIDFFALFVILLCMSAISGVPPLQRAIGSGRIGIYNVSLPLPCGISNLVVLR